MIEALDAVLVAGAYKLHTTYKPPDCADEPAYLHWMHVILQKLCEVYAYVHAHIGIDTDMCMSGNSDKGTRYAELSTVLGILNRTIMSTSHSLHCCGVIAYMDECATRVNVCAGMLKFEPIPEYGQMRKQAAKLYYKFAPGKNVGVVEYTDYTRAVAYAYRHFRQMPDCPGYMYATICVAYYLSLLPIHPAATMVLWPPNHSTSRPA